MKKFLPKSIKNPHGFTLVELLVVISIIAILSIIGIVVFTGVQKNARDGRRRSDVDAISKALETHYVSGTGYPTTNDCSWYSGGACPKDPQTGAVYTIAPFTTTTYTVKALLENGGGNCQTTVANDSYCISQQQ